MAEIKVWRNPREKCWEVRVLMGRKLYGRLFHYKRDAEEYGEKLADPVVLQNELGDPGGLKFLREVM